jgi:CRP-like cAMP-binding protein
VASAPAGVAALHGILSNTPFFADVLDARGLEVLSGRLCITNHGKGTTLIREDDLGSSMFVLASGEVVVTVPGPAGGRRVANLKAPDIFGEMSLLTGARRSATVTARTPIRTIEIPKSALSPLISASPELADRFARMLAKRQRELDRIYRTQGRWSLFDFGGKDLGGAIRGFFGGTI